MNWFYGNKIVLSLLGYYKTLKPITMLSKNYLLFTVLVLSATALHAQNTDLLFKGEIEYEKKVNIVKAYGKYNYMTEEEKNSLPEFKQTYFNLFFDSTKTLYLPTEKETNFKEWQFPAEDNIVYNNLQNFTTVSSKKIEKNNFLFNEKLWKLKWNKTNETRTIAGYECKRANAALWDSIIVIAYYCEAIPVAGGPESFTGLPGMILGLEMPNEHTSIFATAVKKEVDVTKIKQPQQGQLVSYKELDQKLKPILRTYGKDSTLYRIGMFL